MTTRTLDGVKFDMPPTAGQIMELADLHRKSLMLLYLVNTPIWVNMVWHSAKKYMILLVSWTKTSVSSFINSIMAN